VPKTIVVIPTYNERENVPRLLPQVLGQAPDLEVLVVDDQSPDGTGALVAELGRQDARIHLLSRPVREGLGPAYKDGFAWALAHGADVVIQMDADFSHAPEMIPQFLKELAGCDVVLGSRYLKGITVVDWPIERLLLSYFGNWYVRRVTGLPMRDTTGGFKCWRRSALEAVNVAGVRSNGYAFQIEMTYRAWRRGLRIQEIPIIFMDRTVGDSKMTKRISLEALWIAWYLRAAHLFGRL
jgi:dolichol-phosphate mannosyltransferase